MKYPLHAIFKTVVLILTLCMQTKNLFSQKLEFGEISFSRPFDTVKTSNHDLIKAVIQIQNKDQSNIQILNNPGLNIIVKVEYKENDKFRSMDLECRELINPGDNKDELKLISTKEKIVMMEKNVPPLCTLFYEGNYRIQFVFKYVASEGIKHEIFSKWFDFYRLLDE